MNRRHQAVGRFYGLLALTAAIWGVQPLFIKLAVREITPVSLTVVRFILISATIFLIMRWRRKTPLLPPLASLFPLFCMGVTGVAVNNVAQFTGLQYSTVGNATLIASTTPAVTALLAVLFLRERLLPIQWLGIAISLLGVLVLFSKGSLEALLHISFNYGDILFFCAQLGWAAYMLIGFRVMRHLSAMATTAWAGVFGALTTFVYGLFTGELHYAPLSTAGMAYMAYVVWVGGVCAMVFWNLGIKAVGAGQAAVFLNIMPLMGVGVGIAVLGEDFYWQECFGAVGILSGVYLLTQARHILHRRNVRHRNRYRAARRRMHA